MSADWVTAIATVALVVLVFWQLSGLNKQLKLQNYYEYTRRYSEIILNFPEDINESNFSIENHEDKQKVMRYMRAFFDLSFEEWDLYNRGLIDADAWCVWKGGMKTAMSKTAFRQAWKKVKSDSHFGTPFERFLDGLISCPKE